MTGAKVCIVVGIATQMFPILAQIPAVDGASISLVDVLKSAGMVGVLLVLLTVIYKDGKKRQEKLEDLLDANAKASVLQAEATSKHAEATQRQADAVYKVADVIKYCGAQRGVIPPPAVPVVDKP